MAEVLRRERLAGTVACPIVVDGHLWGTITATTHEATLPIDTEVRLEKFTELVATAISNAHATSQLARIAEEQAALRRVATLVANDVPPADIFIAVADEVGEVFGTGLSTALRFEHDPPSAVMMGATKVVLDSFPVGTKVELKGQISSAEVYRTGRPARHRGAAAAVHRPGGDGDRQCGVAGGARAAGGRTGRPATAGDVGRRGS